MQLPDEFAAVVGLPGYVAQDDAAAIEVALDAEGEEFTGLGGAQGSVGEELQAAADLAGGVLDGGQAARLHLGPIMRDIVEVLGVGGDLLEERPGAFPLRQVLLLLVLAPARDEDDYHAAVEHFAAVAELAARYRIPIAFEFIARSSLYGSLLSSLQLLRAAAQPNAGVCLGTFHFFAGISKFEDLDELRPREVEHVHFHEVPGSIPREILVDPDRIPPSHGVIPLKKITAALHRIGYRNNLSTELFGKRYQKGDPFSVAKLCFEALEPYCAA